MSQLAKSQRNKTASFLRSKLPRAYSKQTKRPESSQCEHGLLLDFRSQPAAFNKVNITETLAFLWYLCKSTCPYEGSPSNKLRIRICRQSFMLTYSSTTPSCKKSVSDTFFLHLSLSRNTYGLLRRKLPLHLWVLSIWNVFSKVCLWIVQIFIFWFSLNSKPHLFTPLPLQGERNTKKEN